MYQPKFVNILKVIYIIFLDTVLFIRKIVEKYFKRKSHCPRVIHYVKSVRVWSFSSPHFPAFVLNTERYGVSHHFHTECGKIRTRKTPNTDTFHVVIITYICEKITIPFKLISFVVCTAPFPGLFNTLKSKLVFSHFLLLFFLFLLVSGGFVCFIVI